MSGLNSMKVFKVDIVVSKVGAGSSSSSGFPCSSRPSFSSGSQSPSRPNSASDSSRSFQQQNLGYSSSNSDFTETLYKSGLKVGLLHSAILYNNEWEIHFTTEGITINSYNDQAKGRLDKKHLGYTDMDFKEISGIIADLKKIFNRHTYNLISNNCHHFCNEFAKRVVGTEIPNFLTNLPGRTALLGAAVAGAATAVSALTPGLNVIGGIVLRFFAALRK